MNTSRRNKGKRRKIMAPALMEIIRMALGRPDGIGGDAARSSSCARLPHGFDTKPSRSLS
jgi:hypothetical protein